VPKLDPKGKDLREKESWGQRNRARLHNGGLCKQHKRTRWGLSSWNTK